MIYEKPCTICGGNVGGFSPQGNHYLCEARKKYGAPTPCLGAGCKRCHGTGRVGHPGAAVIDPSPKVLDAVLPRCPNCGGTGIEPGTKG